MSLCMSFCRTFFPSLGILFLLLFTGCTRPETSESNLKFSLPNKSAQMKLGDVSKLATLSHVIINVTGPGMSGPFVFSWDAERPDPNCAGDVCSILVPSGDSRLIQVLAVYEQTDISGDKVMDFQYGDILKPLKASEESVNISVTSIMSGSVTEAELVGRYLETADFGPTGKLEIRYSPPNKPSLLIETREMFGGWFSAFGLIGVPFQYVINGKVIFSGDPSTFEGKLGTNLMKINWPAYFENHSGSSTDFRARDPKVQYVGFFGPGASTDHKVCYPSSPTAIQGSYLTASISSPLQWAPTDTTNSGVVSVQGGGNSTSTLPNACADSSGVWTVKAFDIDPETRGMPDVYGPFLKRDLTESAGTVSWEVLPGGDQEVLGFSLFALDGNLLDSYRENMGDGYRCPDIERDRNAGVSGVYHVGEATTAMSNMTIPSEYQSFAKVLCPRTSFGLMNAAAYSWGSGGGGGPIGPYLRVELMGALSNGDGYDLSQNQCYEAQLKLFENGGTYSLTSPLTITLGTQPGQFSFYTDIGCATPATGGHTIAMSSGTSQSTNTLWVKGATLGIDLQINLTLSGLDNVNFAPMHNYLHVVTAPAILTSLPSSLSFGTVSTSTPLDLALTVTNTGGQPSSSINASIPASYFSFKGGAYPGTGGTCSASLSPGSSCTIWVTFAPASYISVNENLIINYHNGSSMQPLNIPLSGMGGP